MEHAGGAGAASAVAAAAPTSANETHAGETAPAAAVAASGGAGTTQLTVAEARARIEVLEAELKPLRAIVQQADDAAAHARWVPKVMEALERRTWGKPSNDVETEMQQQLETALKVGLNKCPLLESLEEMGKYYDPAWNVSTAAYTWCAGKSSVVINYRHATNLNRDPETQLTVNGHTIYGAALEINGWEELQEHDEHLWPLAVVIALDLWSWPADEGDEGDESSNDSDSDE